MLELGEWMKNTKLPQHLIMANQGQASRIPREGWGSKIREFSQSVIPLMSLRHRHHLHLEGRPLSVHTVRLCCSGYTGRWYHLGQYFSGTWQSKIAFYRPCTEFFKRMRDSKHTKSFWFYSFLRIKNLILRGSSTAEVQSPPWSAHTHMQPQHTQQSPQKLCLPYLLREAWV